MPEITRETSIRLETAVSLAYPDGSVTVAALRREIAAGRLVAWQIGGKHMTTLAEIDKMEELCRVKPKGRISGGGSPEKPKAPARQKKAFGSSSTTSASIAQAAVRATGKALRERLRNTSQQVTASPDGNVVSMKSR